MNMAHLIPIEDKLKTLAYRVLLSRRDLDWNQEELAERSGISRGHISKIERGDTTNITIEVAFALADALGVSRAYVIGLTDDPYGGIPDSVLNAEERTQVDALTQEFLNLYQQLGEDKKQTLLNLARMLRSADEPRIIGGSG